MELGVEVGRRSRNNPDLRLGASVRGAIDFVNVVMERQVFDPSLTKEDLIDCASLTYSSKIWLSATTEKTEEDVIAEIVNAVFDDMEPETLEEINKQSTTPP